ncbi:hypothetical protein PSHT_00433 [Puccinia striiformis]|uniref:Uncharacterized protein n=1 Tax=Puccinia striiformis TaxID=27350 RepID=A0A2S4WN06_9BASI|nr:hypothetical protein PSHT_00433 [Puccinia striiformis]
MGTLIGLLSTSNSIPIWLLLGTWNLIYEVCSVWHMISLSRRYSRLCQRIAGSINSVKSQPISAD